MKIVFPHYTGARSLYIQEGRRDKGRKTAPPPSRCSGTQSCPDATSGPSSPDAHYSDMQLQPRVAPVVTALLPSTRRAGAVSSVSDSYNCSGREAGSAHGDHQRGTVDGEGVNCLGRWAGLITMEGESQKRRSASARHPLPRGDMRSPPRSCHRSALQSRRRRCDEARSAGPQGKHVPCFHAGQWYRWLCRISSMDTSPFRCRRRIRRHEP